jgi:hypothetical protein
MTLHLRTTLFLALIGLFLNGCALFPPAAANCAQHAEAAREYARQLRWRETGLALQLASPPPDGVRPAWQEALRHVEVLDCTVKELTCVPAATTATSTLAMDYLHAGSAALKRVEIPLEWRFSSKFGWSVVSPPPALP